MACITVPVEDSFKKRMAAFPWVNWSEVGREETLKREIFERYLKMRRLSREEEEFCEKIDWHPVDELPLKAEYIEKLKRISKEPSKGKSMSPEELKKWLDEL